MKKIFFFIVLSGLAFTLKAQQQPTSKPIDKLFTPDKGSLLDSVPKLSFKKQNDIKALFLPKPKQTFTSNLIAELHHMPVAKPVGSWNMPVVHPDGTVVYTMPVKRLPPAVKSETGSLKTNP